MFFSIRAGLGFLCVSVALGQVVAPTKSLRFQVSNPEPKGTFLEQAKRAESKIKGKVYRYRAFVRPDADIGLLNLTLRAPVLSVIRVASMPHPDQKISLEAVTSGGRNPHGLVFISGQGVGKNEVLPKVSPLAQTAFDNLDKALKAVQLTAADVLTVTCYLSALGDVGEVQAMAMTRYPSATRNHLQIPMGYGRALVECEAVARAKSAVAFVSPEGLAKSPNFTHVAGISSNHMVWSGLHTAAKCDEAGVRKMFQSLAAALQKHGADAKNVTFSYLYPTTQESTDLTRNLRFEVYSKQNPPASTLIPFAGVGDKNACTAVEVAAAVAP